MITATFNNGSISINGESDHQFDNFLRDKLTEFVLINAFVGDWRFAAWQIAKHNQCIKFESGPFALATFAIGNKECMTQ